MRVSKKPELLAGAGTFSCAVACVKNGCSAVYFGVRGFNMRDLGTNFSVREMPKLVSYLHENNVKAYLAMNTIVFGEELKKAESVLLAAKKAGVDAVICSDLGVMALAKKTGLRIHVSTQASAANSLAIAQYKKLGAKRIVLARELSLKQISSLAKDAKKLGLELEVFVHGAMCIAVSGRCFLSHELFGRSANKGECLQVCRRAFFIDGRPPDFERKDILLQGDTILSAKDLKIIEHLDKIIASGVSSLKIEGRTKPADYCACAVKCYREAVDSVADGSFSEKKVSQWNSELSKVFNRGFSGGFFFETPSGKDIAEKRGSSQTSIRKRIGIVERFYVKPMVAEVKLSAPLAVGDALVFEGKTTYFPWRVSSMEINHEKVSSAKKGALVGIKVPERARKNDDVFAVRKK